MNNTQIPIDELYDQLTLILQEEKYAKSTIQLYQEHVKRIKKFMLANNITDYSSSVADQYYKKEVESRDYNYTTKRFFRTVIRSVVVKHFCNTLFENSPGISSFKWCFPIIVGMRTDMIVPYVHISV